MISSAFLLDRTRSSVLISGKSTITGSQSESQAVLGLGSFRSWTNDDSKSDSNIAAGAWTASYLEGRKSTWFHSYTRLDPVDPKLLQSAGRCVRPPLKCNGKSAMESTMSVVMDQKWRFMQRSISHVCHQSRSTAQNTASDTTMINPESSNKPSSNDVIFRSKEEETMNLDITNDFFKMAKSDTENLPVYNQYFQFGSSRWNRSLCADLKNAQWNF